jgi:hypothetical protein
MLRKQSAMRRLVIAYVLVSILSPPVDSVLIAQQRAGSSADNLRTVDLVTAFYVGRIQAALGLSDDQYLKILPFVREYLTSRQRLASARSRTLAQLRQSVQRKASDAEIQALVDQVDKVELEDQRETHAQFHRNVDPALTKIQRAKLRVFEINIDNQIADLVLRARGGVPAPRPSSPSAPVI